MRGNDVLVDRKLKIFHLASVLHNFTETAAALGMSQPNVTQQIAQLEAELGTPLFERDGRRLRLTPGGRALQAECESLLAAEDQLIRQVQYAASAIRHYRLGATMTAGGYVLPEYLAAYSELHPRCNLSLYIANTDEIADRLKKHQLDLALVEGPFDRNYFFAEPWVQDELVAAGQPGFAAAEFSLAEAIAAGRRLILREPGSGTRYCFDRFLAERGLPAPDIRAVQEVNGFEALKQLVKLGFGFTVISELAIREELAAGTLAAARFTEGRLLRTMHFIYMPHENLKFAERFIAFCRRRLPSDDRVDRRQLRS